MNKNKKFKSSNEEYKSLTSLPIEILVNIFKLTKLTDIICLKNTCKMFCRIVKDHKLLNYEDHKTKLLENLYLDDVNSLTLLGYKMLLGYPWGENINLIGNNLLLDNRYYLHDRNKTRNKSELFYVEKCNNSKEFKIKSKKFNIGMLDNICPVENDKIIFFKNNNIYCTNYKNDVTYLVLMLDDFVSPDFEKLANKYFGQQKEISFLHIKGHIVCVKYYTVSNAKIVFINYITKNIVHIIELPFDFYTVYFFNETLIIISTDYFKNLVQLNFYKIDEEESEEKMCFKHIKTFDIYGKNFGSKFYGNPVAISSSKYLLLRMRVNGKELFVYSYEKEKIISYFSHCQMVEDKLECGNIVDIKFFMDDYLLVASPYNVFIYDIIETFKPFITSKKVLFSNITKYLNYDHREWNGKYKTPLIANIVDIVNYDDIYLFILLKTARVVDTHWKTREIPNQTKPIKYEGKYPSMIDGDSYYIIEQYRICTK